MPKSTCSIEGCPEPHQAKGWCAVHFMRWKRNGDPLEPGRSVIRPNGLRRCSVCREDKDPSEYNKSGNRKDGLSPVCKPCKRSADRASHARHREKRNAESRAWQQANKDAYREGVRRWRAANRERANAYGRAWAARNPEKILANALLRAALKRGAPKGERVSSSAVFERDGWCCQLCGAPIDPTLRYPHAMSASIDHIVPVIRGGLHTYENVQAVHLDCNRRKGSRPAA